MTATLNKWMSGLPADATVADAARVAIGSRVAEVLQFFPLAVEQPGEDIEHVHRLRVATRRSHAVLRLFHEVFPRRSSDKLTRKLRAIRRAAGPARDLDVFLLRLTKEQAPTKLIERVRCEREAAQGTLCRCYAKLREGQKVKRRLDKLVAKTPANGKHAKRLGKTSLHAWATVQLERTIRKFVDQAPDGADAPEQLHQFRIQGKRLRYALETLAPALPESLVDEAYPLLKELQDRLGSLNDHSAAAGRLAHWLNGSDDAERGFLEERIATEHQLREQETRDFHEWWSQRRQLQLFSALRVAC